MQDFKSAPCPAAKARLAMLVLTNERILSDEPTNHLDIEGSRSAGGGDVMMTHPA
jgi:hypothetical protein